MPAALRHVKGSPNTVMPITTAVSGSMAPNTEVSVGPIFLIACTSAMFDRAVAGRARPRIESQARGSVSRRMPPVRLAPIRKKSAPKAMT